MGTLDGVTIMQITGASSVRNKTAHFDSWKALPAVAAECKERCGSGAAVRGGQLAFRRVAILPHAPRHEPRRPLRLLGHPWRLLQPRLPGRAVSGNVLG